MVDSKFLEGRVAEWQRWEDTGWRGRRIPILEYLGMTADEYAAWVIADVIAPRVVRGWTRKRPTCDHLPGGGCYHCCDSCNYDTHRCPGCGEPLKHGETCCEECAAL